MAPAFPIEAALPTAPVDLVVGEVPVVLGLPPLPGEVVDDVPPEPVAAKPTAAGDCLNTVYTFFKNESPTIHDTGLPFPRSSAKNAVG